VNWIITMRTFSEANWRHAFWAVALISLGAAADDASQDSLFTVTVSGVHKLLDTLQTVRDKGVGTYIGDQISQAAREKFPTLFDGAPGSPVKVAKAGGYVYDIGSAGLNTFEQGVNTLSAGSSASAVSAAQQSNDDFWSSFAPDKLVQMSKDVLSDRLRPIVDKVETIEGNATWLADEAQQGVNYVNARLAPYFSNDGADALEPGSRDQGIIQSLSARNGTLPAPSVADFVDDTTQTAAQPESDSSGTFADDHSTDATQPGDRAYKADSDGSNKPPSASPATVPHHRSGEFDQDIADLAHDLGVNPNDKQTGATNWKQEAADAEAETQVWEQQQAEKRRLAEIARQLEVARLQAIEQQREQAEQARQLQAARVDQARRRIETAREDTAVAVNSSTSDDAKECAECKNQLLDCATSGAKYRMNTYTAPCKNQGYDECFRVALQSCKSNMGCDDVCTNPNLAIEESSPERAPQQQSIRTPPTALSVSPTVRDPCAIYFTDSNGIEWPTGKYKARCGQYRPGASK
jgi:hypothetical protein